MFPSRRAGPTVVVKYTTRPCRRATANAFLPCPLRRFAEAKHQPSLGLAMPKAPKQDTTPLFPGQARVFLEAAHGDRLETLYVLAIHTGLRQGELLALRWEDVVEGPRHVGLTEGESA